MKRKMKVAANKILQPALKPPLAIFVVWHPAFVKGMEYANLVFSEFRRKVSDPLSRGMNIPVYFRYVAPVLEIPFDDFQFTVVVPLIDSAFVMDRDYTNYITKLSGKKVEGRLLIPCAIEPSAFQVDIDNRNFARLFEREDPSEYLVEIISHETVRHLHGLLKATHSSGPPPPLKLFISHAKADGLGIATRIKTYIEKSLPLKTFFDANDIAVGYDFSEEIDRYIKDAVLVAVHTDLYASREWCRREVLLAKEHNRPIVVLNCFQHGESRSFPYMANVLTVHFQSLDPDPCKESPVWGRLLTAVLKETLRLRYLEMWISYQADLQKKPVSPESISAYPPELITVLKRHKKNIRQFIYPDPPLGSEELSILREFDPETEFITPISL